MAFAGSSCIKATWLSDVTPLSSMALINHTSASNTDSISSTSLLRRTTHGNWASAVVFGVGDLQCDKVTVAHFTDWFSVTVSLIFACFILKARSDLWEWLGTYSLPHNVQIFFLTTYQDRLKSKIPCMRPTAPPSSPTVVVSEVEVLSRAHSFGEPSRHSTFDQGLPEYSHYRLPLYQYPPGHMRQISETSMEGSREPSVLGTTTDSDRDSN